MQTEVCDNCNAPAAPTDEGHDGWVKIAKFKMHDVAHDDIPAPIKAMLEAQGVGGAHLCPSQHDFCSDKCMVAFVSNGYKPDIEGMFKDISVEDFVTAPPPEETQD